MVDEVKKLVRRSTRDMSRNELLVYIGQLRNAVCGKRVVDEDAFSDILTVEEMKEWRDLTERMEEDLELLRNSIYMACKGTKCLNAHELRQALDAAVRKREVLAAEVIAWREYERAMEETFPGHPQRFEAMKAVRHAKALTNNVSCVRKEKA
jgi:hypothetical protein